MSQNSTIKDGILFIIWGLLTIFAIVLTYFWYTGIFGQLNNILAMTDDKAKAIETYALTIKDYGMVALTFFGITFIGGIFDLHKKVKSKTGKIVKNSQLFIFSISILFLVSFICLFMLYSLIYPYLNTNLPEYILGWLLFSGIALFIMSIILLLFILIMYFLRISVLPVSEESH
jgi:hypothetical protein